MAGDPKKSFLRRLKEEKGRNLILDPIPFAETEIMTEAVKFTLRSPGYFLALPVQTASIITSPTGKKHVYTEGGYKELQEGAYTIQYIDISERFINLPTFIASTIDNFEVSLSISITYKVTNPLRIVTLSAPLKNLFAVCEAVIKQYIRVHNHEEIIGINSFTDGEISKYIIQKINQNRICKVFTVMDVIVVERRSDTTTGKSRSQHHQEETDNTIDEKIVRKLFDSNAQANVFRGEKKPWDAFISHAFEDKEFARALADKLVDNGLRVWFDEFELKVGDSLSRMIDFGLSNSRYGIVVLSPNFFAKEWTQKELGALTARESEKIKIILPIWHNISADEIRRYSPVLADRFAISSKLSLNEVASKVINTIQFEQ